MCVARISREDYGSVLDTDRGLLGGLRGKGRSERCWRALGLLRVYG